MWIRVPRCDVQPLEELNTKSLWFKIDKERWMNHKMADDEVIYKNDLYDLAILAEHEKKNGNLVCPRCSKEYHMVDFDEDEAELKQEADHGPYECWQTHLEMGFCESEAPKDETPTTDGTDTSGTAA